MPSCASQRRPDAWCHATLVRSGDQRENWQFETSHRATSRPYHYVCVAQRTANQAVRDRFLLPDDARRLLNLASSTRCSQQQSPEPAAREAGLRVATRYHVTSRFRGSWSAGQARFSEILDSPESEAKVLRFPCGHAAEPC
jgi:hypothetical protein